MKRTRLNSTASDPAKDFLALRGRARAARIIATPGLPRPYEAFLSGDGYLTWSWYASKKMGTNLPPRALQKPANPADHVAAIVQAVCDYRGPAGVDGPLFLARDTHGLSGP